MKPLVLLDIDGVSANFSAVALTAIYEETGLHYTEDEIVDWDIMKSLGIEDDVAKRIYKNMEVKGLCAGIPVYEGARICIERIRDIADVWAVTHPFGGEHWMHERDAWCVKHLGFHKDDVQHIRSKAKHRMSADVLVEDKVSTLMQWREFNPNGTGILFQRRYNMNDGWDGFAADNWAGIVTLIEDVLL